MGDGCRCRKKGRRESGRGGRRAGYKLGFRGYHAAFSEQSLIRKAALPLPELVGRRGIELGTNGEQIWNRHDVAIRTQVFARKSDCFRCLRLGVGLEGIGGTTSSDSNGASNLAMEELRADLESPRCGDSNAGLRAKIGSLLAVEIGSGVGGFRWQQFQR
jgi:hypothetical protein